MDRKTASAWEGLGGPVSIERANFDGIDPTLESCCRREQEDVRKASAYRSALARHDVVAAKERARRNLVSVVGSGSSTNDDAAASFFHGCRCCYDPNRDGDSGNSEDYPALQVLRRERQQQQKREEEEREEKLQRQQDEEEEEEKKSGAIGDDKNDDDEYDDDEYDYLLDDDEIDGIQGAPQSSSAAAAAVRAYEEQRRAELEEELWRRERAAQHGYGVHRHMHPSRILKAAGIGADRGGGGAVVVLHLFDSDSSASASLDLYLEETLAGQYLGTKFMRSNGRATLSANANGPASKSLPPRLQLPALIVVKDGVVSNVCPNLSGLVGGAVDGGAVVEGEVRDWLDRSGALIRELPRSDEICRIRPEEDALMDYLTAQVGDQKLQDREDLFECGVPGCQKTYHHEHVGIQNEQQRGVVVPEQEVLGDAAGGLETGGDAADAS